jgi:multiple sugar transport system substrate-binding protein
VPYSLCGVILQLDLDVFQAAGIALPPPEKITWDWIADVGPRMSRLAGNPKGVVDYFCVMPDMASMLLTFGGRIFDDPRNPRRVLVNSPEAEAMCLFVRRAVGTKAFLPRIESLKPGGDTSDAHLFGMGRTAARISGVWERLGRNEHGESAKIPFDWDVRPFPAGPHGLRVTADGGFMLGISAHTKYPEAARRFARFYLTARSIRIRCASGSFLPVYREMTAQPGVMPPDNPRSKQYYSQTMEEGMSALPVYGPGLMELRRIIDDRLAQLSSEPNLPIPTILETLQGEIERWLKREKTKGFYR